jgi:hypothetical protein
MFVPFLAYLTKLYNLTIISDGLQEIVTYFLPRNFPGGGGNVHIYEKYLSE